MAVASAGPYANHLRLASDRDNHASTSSLNFSTGWMLSLTPNQVEPTVSKHALKANYSVRRLV